MERSQLNDAAKDRFVWPSSGTAAPLQDSPKEELTPCTNSSAQWSPSTWPSLATAPRATYEETVGPHDPMTLS